MSYTIPTDNNPTPVSRSVWGGLAIGFVASTIIPFAPIIGLISGYIHGQMQKKEELATGTKQVKDPTFWNSTLAKGVVIGTLIGIGLFLLSSGLGIGAAVATAKTASAAYTTAATGVWIGIAAKVIATITGAVIGGNAGQKRMEAEYEQAKSQRTGKSPAHDQPDLSTQPAISPTLSQQPALETTQDGPDPQEPEQNSHPSQLDMLRQRDQQRTQQLEHLR